MSTKKDYTAIIREIDNSIITAFSHAIKKYGFVDAYELIFTSEFSDIKRNVINESLKSILYYDDKEVLSSNISVNIREIIRSEAVHSDDKIFIIFQYFKNIYDNTTINSKSKLIVFDNILSVICDFHHNKKDFSQYNSKAILYIYKDYVLLNKEPEMRNKLFDMILKYLFIKNQYNSDEYYYTTIGELFISTYIFSFYENQTIRTTHSSQIQELLSRVIDGIDNIKINFTNILKRDSQDIIEYYSKKMYTDEHFWLFDYFPEGGHGRFGESPKVRDIRIIICIFSLLWPNREQSWPFDEYINTETISDENYKRETCMWVLDMFEYDGSKNKFTFKERAQEEHSRIKLVLDLKDKHNEHNIAQYFNKKCQTYYNNQKVYPKNKDKTLEEINKELENKLQKENPLGYDPKYNENPKVWSLEPSYVDISECETENTINFIGNFIDEHISDIISYTLPEIELKFEKAGLKTLMNLLDERKIKSTNFDLNNEIYDENIMGSPEYNKLVNKLNQIEHFNAFKRCKIFLSILKNDFKFNLIIKEYNLKELKEENIINWCNKNKIAENLYKIEFCYYTFEEAREYARKRMRIKHVIFDFMTNLTKEDGFNIKEIYK